MTDILVTRVNRKIYSAKSCQWNIALAPYVGILAFDYEEKLEKKLIHAGRRDGTPLGITAGKYSIDGLSMTMLLVSWEILSTQLSILGLGSIGDASFPINFSCVDVQASLQGVPPVSVDIDGCTVSGVKRSYAEGVDEQVVEVSMMALSLTENGKRLWSVANGVGQ